jgi:hypothetical protein
MQRLRKILLAIALIPSVPAVFACAESMLHPDQGMRYHGFTTRHPADILFYQGDPAIADSGKQIFTGLQRAGHHLTVVDREPAAIDALASRHIDLIIASPSQIDALAAHLDSSRRAPAVLAVIDKGDKADETRFPQHVLQSDGLTEYLKSIERTMREHKS